MKCGDQKIGNRNKFRYGCQRRLGHKGFCTKTEEIAYRYDLKEKFETQIEDNKHPIKSFKDITICDVCFSLVPEKYLERHERTHP